MPYVIAEKTTAEIESIDLIPAERIFTDRATAFRTCQTQFGSTFHVLYHDTPTERTSWQARELSRFRSGDYQQTPWEDDGYDRDHLSHYAHLSVKTPGKIAYTPSSEHGYQDRQIVINPGRYLEQYYSGISIEKRQEWIARCAAEYVTLTIATTADEIERVYRGKDWSDPDSCPIRSCMGPDCHEDFDVHPTRVYGDSDLAVAYLGPIDRAQGRCVVWPARKRYSRPYGSDVLVKLLEKSGYSRGSMSGACIQAIPHGRGLLMPYTDGCETCEHDGDGWLRLGSGSIDAQRTDGSTPDEPPTRRCEHCGHSYEYDEDEDSGYCSSCEESRQYCESCETDYFSGTDWYLRVTIYGHGSSDEYVCEHCAKQDRCQCLACDDSWYEIEEFTDRQEQRDRLRSGIAGKLCRNCQDEYRLCSACDQPIAIDATVCPDPDCAQVPRCAHTADLLTAVIPEPAETVHDLDINIDLPIL